MAKRRYSAEYKAKLVLEVLREEKQLGEIAAENNVSPNQLRNWKKEFIKNSDRVFSKSKEEKKLAEEKKKLERERDDLLISVGQASFERDWLKKKAKEIFGPDYEEELDKY